MPLSYARAAVGSRNPAKIEAVRRALARLAPGCDLEAVDVASGVPVQPAGDHATRQGARNRAQAALEMTGTDVAFGLEGGVAHEPPVVWLVSWVTDRRRRTVDGRIRVTDRRVRRPRRDGPAHRSCDRISIHREGTPDAANSSAVCAKGFAFTPAQLSVNKGATVTWTNDDGAAHTVTSGKFDEQLEAGKTFTLRSW